MTPTRALTMILVAAACTFATRVAPFLLFNGKKPIPPIVRYLGARSHRVARSLLRQKRKLACRTARCSRAAVHRCDCCAACVETQQPTLHRRGNSIVHVSYPKRIHLIAFPRCKKQRGFFYFLIPLSVVQ